MKEQTSLQVLDQSCRNIFFFVIYLSAKSSHALSILMELLGLRWRCDLAQYFSGFGIWRSLSPENWMTDPGKKSSCLLSLSYTLPRIFCGRLTGNTNICNLVCLLWPSYSNKGFESSASQVGSPSLGISWMLPHFVSKGASLAWKYSLKLQLGKKPQKTQPKIKKKKKSPIKNIFGII